MSDIDIKDSRDDCLSPTLSKYYRLLMEIGYSHSSIDKEYKNFFYIQKIS